MRDHEIEALNAEIKQLRALLEDRTATLNYDNVREIARLNTHINKLDAEIGRLREETSWQCLRLADKDCAMMRLHNLLARCRTVLNNMAWERESKWGNRWHISHEPLRADAKNLLPLVDAELREVISAI